MYGWFETMHLSIWHLKRLEERGHVAISVLGRLDIALEGDLRYTTKRMRVYEEDPAEKETP